jgi:hypothetical protein
MDPTTAFGHRAVRGAGVRGIVRDIFAMGARPIALLDSLRFGPPQSDDSTPADVAARNRHLFNGVVAGIGGYGNCIGVPTVGGEVSFSPSYSGNPLVNAMCVGGAYRQAGARAPRPQQPADDRRRRHRRRHPQRDVRQRATRRVVRKSGGRRAWATRL